MKRQYHVRTKLLQIFNLKFLEDVSIIKPMKRILKSETIGNFKFFPNDNSSGAKFTFFNFEFTGYYINDMIKFC